MRIIIAALFICLFLNVDGQIDTIKWVQQSSLPDVIQGNAVGCFLLDSDFYVVGGEGGAWGSISAVWKYRIPTDSWVQLGNLPFGGASSGGSFMLGNTGYFFGGYKTGSPNFTFYKDMWSFDATPLLSYTGIKDVSSDVDFKVYPNPASHDNGISISTSQGGSILFYDALGRVLDERMLMHGTNQIKLIADDEVVFYRATMQYGAIENGKVVFIK